MSEYGVARQPFQPPPQPEWSKGDRLRSTMKQALYSTLNAMYGSDAIRDAPLDFMMPIGGMVQKGGRRAVQALKTYVRPEDIKLRKPAWAGDASYHTMRDSAEVLHGTPVRPEQLQETLYHVSPRLSDIQESGAIRHLPDARGGLGGGTSKAHQGVSFTTKRETALNIKREILRNNEVAIGKVHEDIRPSLLRYAAEDEKIMGLPSGTLKQTAENIASRYETNRSLGGASAKELGDTWRTRAWDSINEYRFARERLGGPENPIFFGGWKDFVNATPENVGIVAVNPKQLPTDALIRQDPIGGGHLAEVMVHADVPVHESKFVTRRGDRVGPSVNNKPLPMARTAPVSPTSVTPFELMQLGLSKGAPPYKMGSK